MLTDLTNDDTLYDALCLRSTAYEGRAWVGVSSTGIFCRLSCPARKPLRQNCRFFDSVAACLEAGFRPCKRCHPIGAGSDPLVADLLDALAANPAHRWRESNLITRGLDPSTVRRAFKRAFGVSFLELARLHRLGHGFTALGDGAPVIEAQLDAGFDSSSGFREAFARLLGQAPGTLARDAMLRADWIASPLGPMIAVSCQHRLHLLEFADRKALPTELQRLRKTTKQDIAIGPMPATDQMRGELDAYFTGGSARFETPLHLHGTAFTREVWTALRQIPAGQTVTYAELARSIGRSTATRAVARANGANQIAIAVPCHRVIGADGSPTGYGGGIWRKQKLIEVERQYAP